jgi:hypothetical protein
MKLNISNGNTTQNIEIGADTLETIKSTEVVKPVETLDKEDILVYEKESSLNLSSTSITTTSSGSEVNYSTDEDYDDEDESLASDEWRRDDSSVNTYDRLREVKSESESDWETESETSQEQQIFAYINKFPVQLICLEKCHGTLDDLFVHNKIDQENGPSILLQIIMILITYQKAFYMTHNDLHTNNIMFTETNIEYLYYKIKDHVYKVPTYGKIFKIIDFGRAIYKYEGRKLCSDSFALGGDAHSQYNCEPFMNEDKPRLEPNYSFDLCRLGTSVYDFVIDADEEIEELDPFQTLIRKWCLDDNGKNILYKRDGSERYEGFKMYKMIARTVHNCVPEEQLKEDIFKEFRINTNKSKLDTNYFNDGHFMDIDAMPKYI